MSRLGGAHHGAEGISEAERAERLEAASWLYGDTLKLARLASGRWAVFDRAYALRALLDTPPSAEEIEELWRTSNVRAAMMPQEAKAKPPSKPGKININLSELFK